MMPADMRVFNAKFALCNSSNAKRLGESVIARLPARCAYADADGRNGGRRIMAGHKFYSGRRARDRTWDPQLRRLMLYPTELRAHASYIVNAILMECAVHYSYCRCC